MESYSIAEARDSLSALVDAAERGKDIEITRYGRPVAVLTSAERVRREPRLVGIEAVDRVRAELAHIKFEPDLNMAAVVREIRDEEN